MQSTAVILNGPRDLGIDQLRVTPPGAGDLVVAVSHSGISTGTEKLLWTGDMPPFPGLGYPLVPGYEATGEVIEASAFSGYKPGDRVFVPGANCFEGAAGLFGGAASLLVTDAERVTRIDPALKEEGALLALAATARHAVAGLGATPPDLIVGHGALGRLLARVTVAIGAPAPTVWEVDEARMDGAQNYRVVRPEDDPVTNYSTVLDASGSVPVLNDLIGRIARGGEIVLAGFYAEPISFAFPPAFMKEARFRIAAEWTRDDLVQTRELVETGALSLGDLITHRAAATDAEQAYATAFTDSSCLKMILDWKGTA